MLTINIHEYFKFQRNSNFPFSRWKHENSKEAFGNFAWMSFLHRGGETEVERCCQSCQSSKLISGFLFAPLFFLFRRDREGERREGGKKVIKSFRVFWFWWVCSWSAFTLTFLWSHTSYISRISKQKLCKKHKKEMLAKDLYLCLIKMF